MDKNKKAIEIYDAIAEDYSKTYDNPTPDESLVFQNTILSYLKPRSHIVDIGCGTGFSADYFSKKGMVVDGIDLSCKMIEIAQKKHSDINFSVADMIDYKPSQKVDAVYAGYSMFHFDQLDFEKTLKNIKSYLKQGGIFALVMQEGEGEIEQVEPFLPEEKIYIKLYTEKELTQLLGNHGFQILDIKRKIPKNTKEFPYNKLLIITKSKSVIA